MSRQCPDCGIEMERVDFSAGGEVGDDIRIDDPRESGVAGLVGGKTYLDAYLCEECDLVRFYAQT